MARVVMTPAEEEKNLKETAAMLNDASEAGLDWKGKNYGHKDAVRLRRLVLAWKEAGCDLRKTQLETDDRARLEGFAQGIRVRFESDGTLHLVDFYSQPYDAAAMNFTRLIRNSQRVRLGGPCRHCDQWYVSKTQRETLYCSPRCGGSAAKDAERKRKRDRLISGVRKALRNYETRPARFAEMGWKEFVAKAVPGAGKKWLTMAVKSGEIFPPKEGE